MSHYLLYCDDERFMRMYVEEVIRELETKDLIYLSFEDGERLLSKLTTLKENCVTVFTDQNMGNGKITGLDLIREIRSQKINCKIYLISNEGRGYFEEKAREAGADGFIELPFSKDIIKNILYS